MRERVILCNKFEFISILDIKGRKAANEHASFYIRGHIDQTNDDYVIRSSAGQSVEFTAFDSDGEKKIFNGLICDVNIHNENEMRILTVSVVSRSTQMDLDPETRTFQNSNMDYKAVTNRMEKKKGNFDILWPTHGGVKIGSMTVQYEKTDWKYAMQLAGRLGTVVVPDYLLDTTYISIGIPKRPAKPGINAISYTIRKDLEKYRDSKAEGRLSERDTLSYIVESRDIYDLCDPIPFLGLSLYVYAIDTRYKGDQLVHYYTLKEEGGFYTKKHFNENLVGACLRGTVTEVKEDKVRVGVLNDVDQTEHKWFPYATPFSQPDGYGFYFMPEIGDEIRLQFPSEKEDDAYVSSAVHITHGNRLDPEVKFIRTVYGQVIQFCPDKIWIYDGDGSSITMHKEKGISLETDKTINIEAQEDASISAFGKTVLTGLDGVVLKKGDSVISVDDPIDISSEHTRIQ